MLFSSVETSHIARAMKTVPANIFILFSLAIFEPFNLL
jgi:hypothetical protein